MSEEKETKQGKQANIKTKLKDMGVIREDRPLPDEHTPFWRNKMVLATVFVIGIWAVLWSVRGPQERSPTDNPTTPTAANPYAYPPGAQPSLPPSAYGPATATNPSAGMSDKMEAARREAMMRGRPHGPPPGWAPPYPPYGGYYPPPPPAYYGYGPGYGPPPPGYGYPYGGYYPPPPWMQIPKRD